ncbi:hypothetical protein P5G50_02825 [Leifsonia sp. F6_8S_P_1B]|uniref:Uncharacterized protein n=1 Tax=Leifsonia williamsii TaxID=3035919 RepID=A0ABT8K888_9MICO|nr:hypothetical protein [Leifsonia williamsii]MDN4613377.1 hypothetical protein [Leifsonia williamsii]
MSDTSGLPNTDAEGVPAEEHPERFEQGPGGASGTADAPDTSESDVAGAEEDGSDTAAGAERDAQAAEPAETESGQSGDTGAGGGGAGDRVSAPGETGVAPEGAEDVTTAATTGSDSAEPPPADFDPAQQPSNPDLVGNTEPPD